MKLKKSVKIFLILIVIFALFFSIKTISEKTDIIENNITKEEIKDEIKVEEKKITHVKTPENVRGIYVSANSFLYKPFLENLDKMIDNTNLNTIVVDIKDAPGIITYDIGMDHLCIKPLISKEDLEAKLEHYHNKNIYVIARIAVFRDECFTKLNPDLAAIKADSSPWRDSKGHYWLAPHEKDTAEYILKIAKSVYERGFDEIQLDYVRYPSDGQMKLLKYEYADNINSTSTNTEKRRSTLGNFLSHIREGLGKDIPLSADIFGMVLTNKDDLTIGQHLEEFVPNVDYISGMIYPSHFPNNWNGIPIPNKAPYKTIYDSTKIGLDRMTALYGTSTAIKQMRPWLQDFSIFGVNYGSNEVNLQIKALEDLGVKSFLLWNASNRYSNNVLNR